MTKSTRDVSELTLKTGLVIWNVHCVGYSVQRTSLLVACSMLSIRGSEQKQRRAKNQAIQGERAGARGLWLSRRPPFPDPPHFFLTRPPLVVRPH